MICDDEMKEIIKDDIKTYLDDTIKNKKHGLYSFDDFNFHDLTISMYITHSCINDDNNISLICKSNCLYLEYINFATLFHKKFKTTEIDILIDFILNFRKNYTYSKISDKILNNKLLSNLDKKKIAIYKFTKNKDVEKCCVCYDYNTLFTKCKHNLCRCCYQNIKFELEEEIVEMEDIENYKLCPMCRSKI